MENYQKRESYKFPRPLFVTLLLSRILMNEELRKYSALDVYCLVKFGELTGIANSLVMLSITNCQLVDIITTK